MKKQLLTLALALASGFGMSLQAQTYCSAGPSSTADSEITGVELTGDNFSISRISSSCGTTGVQNFTSTDSADVSWGTTYSIDITMGTCGGSYSGAIAAWIDFNGDGDFLDAGEKLGSYAGSPTTTQSFSFTVDSSATLGTTRMRVMQQEAGTAFGIAPCNTFTWGAVEDYTIVITSTPPACTTPTGVAVTTGQTWAAVTWTGSSSASSYVVEYGTAGFTLSTGDTAVVYTDSAYITGLNPNTAYDFYVRADCGTSSSGFGFKGNTFTACAPFATPYSEDFDAGATGNYINPSMPSCWAYYSDGTYPYWYVRNYSAFANSGSNMVYGYKSSGAPNGSTYGDTAMFATPEITGLDSANKMVKFYARTSSASYQGMIIVGVTDAQATPSSFTIVDTVYAPSTGYQQFQIYLDSIAGIASGDARVAFAWIYDGGFDYVYIDDIEVVDIPPCPEPTAISMVSATTSGATLSWVSPSSNFQVEVGPVGFTQGTGTITSVSGYTYTATGLNQNTEYDFYVMSDCSGTGDGSSPWIGPFTFRTECGDQMAPYYTGFEGFVDGTSSFPDLPYCWTYEKRSSSTAFYAYNYDYAFNSYAGINHLYYYGYVSTLSTNSAEGDTLAVGSPRIAGLANNDKEISWYGRGSTSTSTLYSSSVIVAVADTNADLSTMTIVDTVDMGNAYQKYTVELTNVPSNASRVMLVMIPKFNPASTSTYGYNYFYIDEVTIRDIPQCPEPMNVLANATSDTSIAITWSDSSTVSQYFIEWGPEGFAQGTGAPIDTIVGTSWMVDTLMANTGYDFYVQSECMSLGVNSPWVGPITVTTPCAPVAVPFTDGFEGSPAYSGSNLDPNLPSCWAYDDDGGTSYTYGYGYSYYALHGSYSLRSYMISGYGDTDVVSTPMIQDLDKGGNVLTFYARTLSTSYPGQFDVVMTDAMGNYETARTVQAINLGGSTTYTEYQVYLDSNAVQSGDMRVGFRFYSKPATYDYVHIDSVTIDAMPACVSYNHNMVSSTSSSATFDWDYAGANCFNVEIGAPGFIQGTGTGSLAGTTYSNVSAPYTFSGLSANTEYEFYVENCCNPGTWQGPFTFRTECTGPLMGNYTVGTGGDFANLDSVFASLDACGISGNVEFSLLSGTHTTGRELGYINGSATGHVTIKGAAGANDTIASGMTLNGTENVTFDDVYIKTMGGNGVRLNGTNNVSIINSTIDVGTTTTTTTNAIVASSSSTSIYSTTSGEKNLTIENNNLIGGYFAVRLYGSSAAYNDSVIISGNTITDAYYYGIYVYYGSDVEINNNDMSGFGSAYAYGVYTYYVNGMTMSENNIQNTYYNYIYYTTDFSVTKNYINSGYYGLSVYYSGSANSTSVLANNMIEAGQYGIYSYYSNYVDYYHNTAKGVYGINDYQSTQLDVRNNIFAGSTYPMYKYSTASTNTNFYDYNLLYNTSGDSIVAYFKSAPRSLTGLQAADTTMNVNSKAGNPIFINGLHVAGMLANDAGDNSVGITEDYDGDTRPYAGATTVDIGADEYEPLNDDAALSMLLSPVVSGCGGDSLMVEVVISNLGFNTITSVPVGFDGLGSSLNQTASTNIAFGESDTIMLGYVSQLVGGTYTVSSYTNLSGDQRTSNDTLVSEVTIGDVQQVSVDYPAEVCAGDDVNMSVTHPLTGNFIWMSGMDTVATTKDDSTLTISGLTMDTTFTVMATSTQEFIATPLPTATWSGSDGVYFTVNETATLDSVSIFPLSATGSETVVIIDQSTGATVFSTVVSWNNAAAATETPVAIGQALQPGFYLLLRSTTTSGSWYDIYVGTGANGYPFYSTDSTVTLDYGTFSTYIEYFFNWHFTVGGCDRPDTTFTVGITPDAVAALTVDTANAVVTATDWTVNWDASGSMNADSIYVEVSNGTSSNATSGSATFTANNMGETITVIAFGPCNSDTVTYTFDVEHISVREDVLNGSVAIYPNPTRGAFQVEFSLEGTQEIEMSLVNTLGQVMTNEVITVNGVQSKSYDLTDQPAGVYFLRMTTDKGVTTKRITLE